MLNNELQIKPTPVTEPESFHLCSLLTLTLTQSLFASHRPISHLFNYLTLLNNQIKKHERERHTENDDNDHNDDKDLR